MEGTLGGDVGDFWVRYLWVPFVAILSWLMKLVWDTKADKADVLVRPTDEQVRSMIKVAVDTFAALDTYADDARIAPLAQKMEALKEQTLQLHAQNREDLREVRDGVNQLLRRHLDGD